MTVEESSDNLNRKMQAIGIIADTIDEFSETIRSPITNPQTSVQTFEDDCVPPESGDDRIADEFNQLRKISVDSKDTTHIIQIEGGLDITTMTKDNRFQSEGNVGDKFNKEFHELPQSNSSDSSCRTAEDKISSSIKSSTHSFKLNEEMNTGISDDARSEEECSKNITETSLNDDLSVEPSISTCKTLTPNHGNFMNTLNSSIPSAVKRINDQSLTPSDDEKLACVKKFNDSKHLERFIEKQKDHYETMIEEQKEQHSAQIDEILDQLNTIENDYQYEISNLQMTINKKEILTEALTNSLSEFKSQNYTLNDTVTKLEAQCSTFTTELASTNQDIENLRQEMVNMRQTHAKEIEDEQNQRVKSITDAQNEIRTAAERQFALAQKKYVQLKTDHSKMLSECDDLKSEVSSLKQEKIIFERKYESEVAQLMSELAETRACLATSQADAMKLKSMYGSKTAKLISSEKELEMRLNKVEAECRDAHTLVGSVVREKEKLKVENADLQSLCEELMGIVEGVENTNHSMIKVSTNHTENESGSLNEHNKKSGSYEEVESL